MIKEKVKEYLNSIHVNEHDGFAEGFSREDGHYFNTSIVSEEEDYLKHKTRLITYVHRVEDTDIYFAVSGRADYDYGLELDEWYFVEPHVKTTTVYKMVKT